MKAGGIKLFLFITQSSTATGAEASIIEGMKQKIYPILLFFMGSDHFHILQVLFLHFKGGH